MRFFEKGWGTTVLGLPVYVVPRWLWPVMLRSDPLVGIFQNIVGVDWNKHRLFGVRVWMVEFGWRGGDSANAPEWLRHVLETRAPEAWVNDRNHMSSLRATYLILRALLAIACIPARGVPRATA